MKKRKKINPLLKIFIVFVIIILAYQGYIDLASGVMNEFAGFFIFCVVIACLFIAWQIYKFVYFHGKTFKAHKEAISSYITECNELNEHILSLEGAHDLTKRDFG